ncbi:MAG: hypothetical protein ABJZ55_07890 [Fuerstiella sp.]
MTKQNENPDHQISRTAAITWCCLLPNFWVLMLAGLVWQLNIFGDWQPAGLQLLTSAETLQRVQNVVGIGGTLLTLVLLCLVLIPNLLITLLVSAREFRNRTAAFALGISVCVLLPAFTVMMLILVQPS